MMKMNKKNIFFFALTIVSLSSCSFKTCGSTKFESKNISTFFKEKGTIDDPITYCFNVSSDYSSSYYESSYFKANESKDVEGYVLGYKCVYAYESGECILQSESETMTINLNPSLSAKSVSEACFSKLDVIPLFSSNDALVVLGDYFLKLSDWYYSCMRHISLCVELTAKEFEDSSELKNGIKQMFGNEEFYNTWHGKTFYNEWAKCTFAIGMNSDMTQIVPDIFIGNINLYLEK